MVRVGVFQGNGGAQTCIWETIASIQLDPDMTVRTITTSDIANGVLRDLDAIIIPGGEGATQYMNLGEENMERIRNFIRSGKVLWVSVLVPISLQTHQDMLVCTLMVERQLILSMIIVDMEYQPFSLTAEGKKLFPELAKRDKSYVMYYEGPVLVKSDNIPLPYTTMAIMEPMCRRG